MSAATDTILEQLKTLSLLEAAELVKQIEEAFGVSAAAPVGVAMAAGGPAAAAEVAEEQTEFNVVLEGLSDDSKKISVLKVVRAITGLGLKEAKDLVEAAPKDVLTGVPKAAAEDAKKQIEEAGGKVAIK
jgi:large subunit ribosomal protein L7/L12